MRHVPTAIYIDTTIFVQNNLRFDTKSFVALTNTFIKGGLRLLIPEIMERELLRKFEQRAENVAEKVINAHREYPINQIGLLALPRQEELKEKCFEVFNAIISGPSKEDYRDWMDEKYGDEAFRKRQRYFHLRQLYPFALLLKGDLRQYYDELIEEIQPGTFSDDVYLSIRAVTSGFVTYRSPKSF